MSIRKPYSHSTHILFVYIVYAIARVRCVNRHKCVSKPLKIGHNPSNFISHFPETITSNRQKMKKERQKKKKSRNDVRRSEKKWNFFGGIWQSQFYMAFITTTSHIIICNVTHVVCMNFVEKYKHTCSTYSVCSFVYTLLCWPYNKWCYQYTFAQIEIVVKFFFWILGSQIHTFEVIIVFSCPILREILTNRLCATAKLSCLRVRSNNNDSSSIHLKLEKNSNDINDNNYAKRRT